jgi:serine/threonine protein kinase
MMELVGQQLGTYRLIRPLGHGGSASVYLGQHVFFNTQYAIKVWQDSPLHSEAITEAQTIVNLKHPHIIAVHYFDIDAHTGWPFLVMDYAPEGTLRQRHPEGMILEPELVCQYVQQVASALTYAHQRNLIHRDIKPENMLVGQQGNILLSDFGIAIDIPSFTTPGKAVQKNVAGTIEYMAPELFLKRPVPASDQYALGIVVYEWLCGGPPFSGSDVRDVMHQHMNVRAPSLLKSMPALPPAVETVVFRALEKQPSMRFPTVSDFVEALEDACGIKSAPPIISSPPAPPSPAVPAAPSPIPAPPAVQKGTSHMRRTIIGAGIAAGIVLATGGTIWWKQTTANSPRVIASTSKVTPTMIASDGLLTPGVLTWGADAGPGGAPYVFLDANGAPIGFEVDIAAAIAQRMGITQTCQQTPYTHLEDALRSRQIDIILNGWEVTPGRQKDESFSMPYYRYSQQLVVRANDSRFATYTANSSLTLEEIKHYRVGTGSYYKAADLLQAAGIHSHTSDVPLDDLKHAIVDIVMIDTPIVAYYVLGKGTGASLNTALRPIGKPLFADSMSNYVIGLKKGDPNANTLRNEIDQALLQLKQDGTLHTIYQRWGLWNDFQHDIAIT